MLNKPIVLIGMPGSGKSCLGELIAAFYTIPFYDSDKLIEKTHNKTIDEIFTKNGESAFREIEQKIISDLIINEKNCIIATGGGSIAHNHTRSLILNNAFSIYLKTNISQLSIRLKNDHNIRPLLKNKDLEATLIDLLTSREQYYLQANYTFNSYTDDIQINLKSLTDIINKELLKE